jgi:hypothetical protein
LKQEFLAKISKGYGIGEACKLLRFGRSTFYNWKRGDPEFAAECDRILATPVHKERIIHKQPKADTAVDASWQEIFLALYKKTGDRDSAVDGCGIEALAINEAMDPTSAAYDEVFHKQFMEEEQRRLWRIEDSMLRKAEHDMPTARFALSNLLKEKYGKVGGEVTVNQHWFTSKGQAKAATFMGELFDDEPYQAGRPSPGRPEGETLN